MNATLAFESMAPEKERLFTETLQREQGRLRNFIRRRVNDESDAEDILQEVLFEFFEAQRLPYTIEQAGAWMFRVARNRIIDLFRKKRPTSLDRPAASGAEGSEGETFQDLLPSPEAGPEAAYARGILLDQLEDAIDELPQEQRDVFLANEVDGRSFKELAAETGVSINTLLSRKHYAVLFLRKRLQQIHEEFQA